MKAIGFISRKWYSAQATPRLTLTLLGREYCGLCEEAKEQLWKVRNEYPFVDIEEIDIDKGSNMRKYIEYTYDVPVVRVGEQEICRHRVDPLYLSKWIEQWQISL